MSAIDRLPSVTLAELNAEAELLTRVDRKYVVAADELDAVVTGIAGPRVLDIDTRRASRYESTYLDTVGLDSWAASAHRHRRRWKVRTRVYADTGECWLEVKTRGRRGVTVKERLPHDDLLEISGASGEWVRGRLGAAHVHDVDPGGLVPTLRTSYRRTTLLLDGGAGRATVDRDLRWVGVAGVGVQRPRRAVHRGHRVGGPGRPGQGGPDRAALRQRLRRDRPRPVGRRAHRAGRRPGGRRHRPAGGRRHPRHAQLTAGNSFIAWSAIFFIM